MTEIWKNQLDREFKKTYFKNLQLFVKQAYDKTTCYPPKKLIMRALEYCSFEDVRVVILGQDPYHGPGQANGLCFSVPSGISHPASLSNIFKEINEDLGISIPANGNLESWARQGVLLLNSNLTVEKGKAGSHRGKGWEIFTDAIIENISKYKKNVVFMLWGRYAKNKARLIDHRKHFILQSGHPSPLSANRGHWFGNMHFSQTNNYLKDNNLSPIKW